jgi:hypothetical protein
MSKNHRGRGLYDRVKQGRGTCPICKRTAVKLLYEKEIDGNKLNICKICKAVTGKKAS